MCRHGVSVVVVIKPVIAPMRNEHVPRDTFGMAKFDKILSCKTARCEVFNRHAFAQRKAIDLGGPDRLCASMCPRVKRPGETQPAKIGRRQCEGSSSVHFCSGQVIALELQNSKATVGRVVIFWVNVSPVAMARDLKVLYSELFQ